MTSFDFVLLYVVYDTYWEEILITTAKHEPYDEFCFSVYTTNRYFHRLYGQILEPFDLTYLQYMVLVAVDAKQRVSLSTICSMLDLSTNTLTPVIQKLVKKGWLVKKKSLSDSRRLDISLESSSLERLNAVREKVRSVQLLFIKETDQPIEQLIAQQRELNQQMIRVIRNFERKKKK